MVTWANYTLTFLKELRVASRAAICRFLATTRIAIGPIQLCPQFVSRGGLVRKGRETGMTGNRKGAGNRGTRVTRRAGNKRGWETRRRGNRRVRVTGREGNRKRRVTGRTGNRRAQVTGREGNRKRRATRRTELDDYETKPGLFCKNNDHRAQAKEGKIRSTYQSV